ncbi:MAG: hypothetical protein JWR18_3863 [Segetibacter sp.]|nr:hypothetical protein [Segetibacter sp.]
MRPWWSLQDITNRRVKEQDELLEAVTRELKTAKSPSFQKTKENEYRCFFTDFGEEKIFAAET